MKHSFDKKIDIDLVVNPRPLTAKEVLAISESIKKDKLVRQRKTVLSPKDDVERNAGRLSKIAEEI